MKKITEETIVYASGQEYEKVSKEKFKQDRECYSKVELMKYLAEEYRKIGSEADGR